MLTKVQLKKIEEIIKRRFLALSVEMLGEESLTREEIDQLKAAGLLRPTARHFVGESYTLGKIVSHMDKDIAKNITYEKALRAAQKFPTTEVEKKAIRYASEHAGQYIQGIADNMVKETLAIGSRSSMTALRAVQDEVADAIKNRKTVSELKSAFHRVITGKKRDWLRVAHTEMNDSIQRGIYHEIREQSDEGSDQLVYKRPSPNACKHCKRVYLRADGITPKVFKLSDLADTNIGLKANEWLPTIGCFPRDVKVGEIPIGDIKIGDKVLTHKNRLRAVLNKKEVSCNELISINKGELRCTLNHAILVFRDKAFKWVTAGSLRVGDKICRKIKESV